MSSKQGIHHRQAQGYLDWLSSHAGARTMPEREAAAQLRSEQVVALRAIAEAVLDLGAAIRETGTQR